MVDLPPCRQRTPRRFVKALPFGETDVAETFGCCFPGAAQRELQAARRGIRTSAWRARQWGRWVVDAPFRNAGRPRGGEKGSCARPGGILCPAITESTAGLCGKQNNGLSRPEGRELGCGLPQRVVGRALPEGRLQWPLPLRSPVKPPAGRRAKIISIRRKFQ